MASDPKNWMWERARTILDEAERIEREFLRVRPVTPAWAPAVDVLIGTHNLRDLPRLAAPSLWRSCPVAARSLAVMVPRRAFERRKG